MRAPSYAARQSAFSRDMTRDQRDLVRRRTEPFLDSVGVQRPLPTLLAEAYVQGMRDAEQAFADERDKLKSENDWLHSKVAQFASKA